MKRSLALLLPSLLVACADGPAPYRPYGGQVAVRYVEAASDKPAAIEVEAVHLLALASATLEFPGAPGMAATAIDRSVAYSAPWHGRPRGRSGPFPSERPIDGAARAIGEPIVHAGDLPRNRIHRATIRFALADEAAYRRAWKDAKVHLVFGEAPGAVIDADLPAPDPAQAK